MYYFIIPYILDDYSREVAAREMGVGKCVPYFPDPSSVEEIGQRASFSCALSLVPSLMMLITTYKRCSEPTFPQSKESY
jgi:hypothetical protein